MKRAEKFSEALGNIDSRYIEESVSYGRKDTDGKYTEISVVHENKRKNNIWLAFASAAACICIVSFGAGMLAHSSGSAFSPETEDLSVETADKYNEQGAGEQAVEGDAAEPREETEPLYYSKLTKNQSVPDLDYSEYAIVDYAIPENCEENIKNVTAIIEGEITDIYVKKYEFTTPFDKFEPDGVLHHKDDNVVYKIKAEKVLFGDIQEGEIITVEDDYFTFDSIISIKTGSRYVIPICEYGDELQTMDEIIDGDVSRDSIYCTYNNVQPQIEAVEGGYIVPDTWHTIVTDICQNIIVDTEELEAGWFFKDRMYFVPTDIFEKQMNILIGRELKN